MPAPATPAGRKPLQGRRIALAGPRRAAEIARLVEKAGGIPLPRSTMVTRPLDDATGQAMVHQLLAWQPDWVVFTTGAGVEALLEYATRSGTDRDLIALLRRCTLATRGYKTARALTALGLSPTVRDRDGTVTSLLAALEPFPIRQRRVAVQAYGQPVHELTAWLAARGAETREFSPYRHVPAPAESLDRLMTEVLRGAVDAVAFTSAPQARFLFEHARRHGLSVVEALREAFNRHVLAVAVGRVTARALRDCGVARVVVPSTERAGTMVRALAHALTGEAGV